MEENTWKLTSDNKLITKIHKVSTTTTTKTGKRSE